MKIFWIVIILSIGSISGYSQSFWFGPKGALTMNLQKWDGAQRDPLVSINADIYIETEEEYSLSSFYAQIGYHTRGSSTRVNFFNGGSFNQSYKFNNLVLELGAKKMLSSKQNQGPYYLLGLRAEYTLSTNLSEFLRFQSPYYPIDNFVRKFNYGFAIGGGWEFEFSELMGGMIEITINPDVSKQYEQEQLRNIINPFTNQPGTLNARNIYNLSFEIKAGLRFMRKVEYID